MWSDPERLAALELPEDLTAAERSLCLGFTGQGYTCRLLGLFPLEDRLLLVSAAAWAEAECPYPAGSRGNALYAARNALPFSITGLGGGGAALRFFGQAVLPEGDPAARRLREHYESRGLLAPGERLLLSFGELPAGWEAAGDFQTVTLREAALPDREVTFAPGKRMELDLDGMGVSVTLGEIVPREGWDCLLYEAPMPLTFYYRETLFAPVPAGPAAAHGGISHEPGVRACGLDRPEALREPERLVVLSGQEREATLPLTPTAP